LSAGRVVFDYSGTASPAEQVRSLLAAARADAFASGQLRSSTATSSRGLGWIDDGSKLILAAALYGDVNLSGAVDFDDLLLLAQNYGLSVDATWSVGDSTYDGIVDFDDLLALAQNYSQSLAVSVEGLSADPGFAGDWALARALVPEPAALLAGLVVAVAGRRRKA
jgi:hypothetical protein